MTVTHKKKRWIITGVSIIAALGLLLVIAEVVLRSVVPNVIAGLARDAVQLSEDHPVEVDVSGYLTPQVLFGTFGHITVKADDVPLGEGLRATVAVSAEDLPRNPEARELGTTELTATFTEDQLSEVLRTLSKGVGKSLAIEGNQLTIANELSLFGQSIPVSVTVEPSVVDHQLHIEPVAVDAAGILSLGVDQLADFPLFADYANGLDICVASYMPAGVTLEELSLSTTKTLSVKLSADSRIVLDEELQAKGSCAE